MTAGTMLKSVVTPVPAGHVATVVTSLEMLAPPAETVPARSALKLEHWPAPVDLAAYRALFRAIGQPWLWRGRLVLDDAELAAVLNDPALEVRVAARRDGMPQGLLELDFSAAGSCELAYFGMVPGMTGNGHGGWLMAHALKLAWRPGVERVWVHTCDLDHPAALAFYQRHGFRPFARAVEVYPDPRVQGVYPPDTAPQVPIL